MVKQLIVAGPALFVGLAVAMVLRAQRRGRPQPLDGPTDDVYQEIPTALQGMRGLRERQPK